MHRPPAMPDSASDALIQPGTPTETAIPRLLALYGPRLYGFGRRLCGSATEAEDLVQETFLAAARGWPGFEGRSSVRTWLFRIAAHACQRMHRRRAGEPLRLESLEGEYLARGPLRELRAESLQDRLSRAELAQAALGAIGRLPAMYQLPLVFLDVFSLSVAEAAEALGLTGGTVKVRAHRARLMVQQALARQARGAKLPPSKLPGRHVRRTLLAAVADADKPAAGSGPPACERCLRLLGSLDQAAKICGKLAAGRLPARVRARIEARLSESLGPSRPTATTAAEPSATAGLAGGDRRRAAAGGRRAARGNRAMNRV